MIYNNFEYSIHICTCARDKTRYETVGTNLIIQFSCLVGGVKRAQGGIQNYLLIFNYK